MKLPHAAALALLGWYLMMPPFASSDRLSINLKAPLSRWEMMGQNFDSPTECESFLQGLESRMYDPGLVEDVKENLKRKGEDVSSTVFADHLKVGRMRVKNSLCMSSHDPRLKEK